MSSIWPPEPITTILQVQAPITTELVVGQGPAGTSPSGADLNYHHVQALPAASWVIVHGLNKYPSVTIIDSAGDEVEGQIAYDGLFQLTVTFAAAFSGNAYLN